MIPLLELIISAAHGGTHLSFQHLGGESKRIVGFRQLGPQMSSRMTWTVVEEEEWGRGRRRKENKGEGEEKGKREGKTTKYISVHSTGSLIPWCSGSGQREAEEAMAKTGPVSTCFEAGVTGTYHTDRAGGTPKKDSHTRWLCSLTSLACEEVWWELANSSCSGCCCPLRPFVPIDVNS